MPCDMVRLPCGSMSTHSTRCPSSANAAARFSVVVVLATPPFWFAKAMTLAWPVTSVLRSRSGEPIGGGSSPPGGDSLFAGGARAHESRADRTLRPAQGRPYARPVSWSAEHEHDLEPQHRIAPPDPQDREHERPLHQLASDVGNAAFGSTLAREGAGVLPTGEVHPEVQDRIDSTRGSGAGLDPAVQQRLSPSLGDLSDVTVHTDDGADALNRSVSARAFATGSDVYFAKGEYTPGSADGDRLIAHELAHVVQQRGAASSGPLTVSQPGDALETEADSVADSIR